MSLDHVVLSKRCTCGSGKRDSDGRCSYCRSLLLASVVGADDPESYEAGLHNGTWAGMLIGAALGLVLGLVLGTLFAA